MTADPLSCGHTWHPTMPNVRDLAVENTTLRRHLDVCVIALARAHGISETTVRHNMGLPAGNVWRARRAEQAQEGTQGLAEAAIYPFRHPRAVTDENGPQIDAGSEYAI